MAKEEPDVDAMKGEVGRIVLTFMADFQLSVEHLGSYADVLRYVPAGFWPLIDSTADRLANRFIAEHELLPNEKMYDSSALASHSLANCLTHLLKEAWEVGYLLHKFYKSGNALPPTAGSVSPLAIADEIVRLCSIGSSSGQASIEVFLQRVVFESTKHEPIQLAIAKLGSTGLVVTLNPLLDHWADRVRSSMGWGVLAAKAEMELNKEMAVNETFNFHGSTTFFNHPKDSVISDFQNTYGAVMSGDDLVQLLRLVQTSQDITARDRERATALISETAGSLSSGEANMEGTRSRLRDLRAIVERVADIAKPAIAITAGILRAVNS